MGEITPRYSCLFVRRFCPRSCSYCLAKDIRGKGSILTPQQWADALHILESHGVVFHLILGNELLSYRSGDYDCVDLVKALQPFYGRYAMYSTFPLKWTEKWLDKCIDAGLYNISGGVDVWPGLLTGDKHVDEKASRVLYYLEYCLKKGIPDVQATVTIHRHNYDKLWPILDLCTEKGIWVGASLVEYSSDGKHDFYKGYDAMKDWLIPKTDRSKFRDEMYKLAAEIRTGRWKMQVPPSYFEEMGEREYAQQPWHCSLPLIVHLEEDGMLRACSYRGPLNQPLSVFELGPDGSLSMQDYVAAQQTCTTACPGCGGGGGAWSYWWMAQKFHEAVELGDPLGDKVFQTHFPGWEFERRLNDLRTGGNK